LNEAEAYDNFSFLSTVYKFSFFETTIWHRLVAVYTSDPVSTGMGDRSNPVAGHISRYITSHRGQLSLANP